MDCTYGFLVVLLNPRNDKVRYTFSRFVTCYLTAG
nr:MAG TPA: hypothetical protein [Caudoviricetes sp.]